MSLPRDIVPGRFYMLTRACTQRRFLLRPGRLLNTIFLYCLAVAAQLFGIDVILTTVLSNHHHTVLYDRTGRVIEFVEFLHKFVAKAGNALRRRSENFWSTAPPSLVHLVDPEAVMAKLVYVATNPVKDRLVERVHHWPGVHTLRPLLKGRALEVARPPVYFRANGTMPARATLKLAFPPELGDPVELAAELARRVREAEGTFADQRRRAKVGVLGRRAVLAQKWGDRPARSPKRGIRPRIAAGTHALRVRAIKAARAFLEAYRDARRRWLDGQAVVFPYGTYWLGRFAYVSIAPPPPS